MAMDRQSTPAKRTARRPRRHVVHMLLVIAAVCLIPAVALQFTGEVYWGAEEFAVGGALLAVAGTAYVLAARLVSKTLQHVLVGALIVVMVVLVWADLAAGLLDA